MNFYTKNLIYGILFFALFSCKSTSTIQDGNVAYELKKYNIATQLLEKDFAKATTNTEKINIANKIADSYDKQLQFKVAENWYKTITEISPSADAILLYVNQLKKSEKYVEAFDVLTNYLKTNKTEKFKLNKELDFLESIVKPTSLNTQTKFVNLNSINSKSIDFSPFVFGNKLYFSSTNNSNAKDEWTGDGFAKIYETEIVTPTNFSNTQVAELINTDFHNAELVFSKDGNTAYFARCGSKSTTNDFCHIYKLYKNNNNIWQEPKRVILFSDSTNENQPYLSEDGNELYFSADEKNGYGKKDLYVAKKNANGDFENPINLGSKVNTNGNELFPVITKNNILYFSSDGRTNLGGLDIYTANKEGKIFTNVKNLGIGINSGGDDFGIQLLENKDDSVVLSGYLTSNKIGGIGKDDIYYFEQRLLPEKPKMPAIYVLQIITQENIFEQENNPNSKIIAQQFVPNTTLQFTPTNIDKTDMDGKFQKQIEKDNYFKIKIVKDGYFTQEIDVNSNNINAKNGDTIVIKKTITLQKIYKNVEIVLNNIYYDYDKSNVRKDAVGSLDTLITILKENTTLKIQLSSHTDCRGSDIYNSTLSQKRAESVVDYLVQNGINKDRLTAKGYGKTLLLENCMDCKKCTGEQHQKNRRTTFKIVE